MAKLQWNPCYFDSLGPTKRKFVAGRIDGTFIIAALLGIIIGPGW